MIKVWYLLVFLIFPGQDDVVVLEGINEHKTVQECHNAWLDIKPHLLDEYPGLEYQWDCIRSIGRNTKLET